MKTNKHAEKRKVILTAIQKCNGFRVRRLKSMGYRDLETWVFDDFKFIGYEISVIRR